MRILITNDDGVDAPGLAILEQAAQALSDDVWLVAPATEQSGQSHAVTLVSPLRVAKMASRRYAVSGTPADCVAIALNVVLDSPPDLILSGINQGFNIADDMLYSGTVGAAMEGASSGIRSIALSQAYRRIGQEHEQDIWSAARGHCLPVLRRLIALDMSTDIVLNVNFPPCEAGEVTGILPVRQGSRKANEIFTDDRIDGRGHAYHWIRFRRDAGTPPPDTDLGAMGAKRISVTPLQSDLTSHRALGDLQEALVE